MWGRMNKLQPMASLQMVSKDWSFTETHQLKLRKHWLKKTRMWQKAPGDAKSLNGNQFERIMLH